MKGFSEELIAPCGMDCRICVGYFGYTMTGKKRHMQCIGCKPKNKSCAHLKKYCKRLLKNEVEYCYECPDFPCEHIQRLDSKYREKYQYSTIQNLEDIRDKGMDEFLRKEKEKFKCPNCHEVYCVHTRRCYSCGTQI